MTTPKSVLFVVIASFFTNFFAHANASELTTVEHVDLARYAGLWHEIARLPNDRQKDCVKTEVFYKLTKNNALVIKNKCILANNKTKTARAITRIEDSNSNAKIKVNFVPAWLRWMGIGWGNYWIIDLDADYSYAVVSEPKGERLWILSRTREISKATYDTIINKLAKNNFDTSKLLISGEIK